MASVPISFNDLLRKAGLDLHKVRLLRHHRTGVRKGRTLYELWRDNREEFDRYQVLHATNAHRSLVNATHWAAFVESPEGTMFVGLYRAEYIGLTNEDYLSPTDGTVSNAGSLHEYRIERDPVLSEYDGRIFIDWGHGSPTYF